MPQTGDCERNTVGAGTANISSHTYLPSSALVDVAEGFVASSIRRLRTGMVKYILLYYSIVLVQFRTMRAEGRGARGGQSSRPEIRYTVTKLNIGIYVDTMIHA